MCIHIIFKPKYSLLLLHAIPEASQILDLLLAVIIVFSCNLCYLIKLIFNFILTILYRY